MYLYLTVYFNYFIFYLFIFLNNNSIVLDDNIDQFHYNIIYITLNIVIYVIMNLYLYCLYCYYIILKMLLKLAE